jgi:hypothetical protein
MFGAIDRQTVLSSSSENPRTPENPQNNNLRNLMNPSNPWNRVSGMPIATAVPNGPEAESHNLKTATSPFTS